MKHLKKYNESMHKLSTSTPTSKFYWLMDKNPLSGESGITIGRYTDKEKDGSGGPYWDIIASDESLTDEEVNEYFEVMDEIPLHYRGMPFTP